MVRCTPSTVTSSRCFDCPLASSTRCLLSCSYLSLLVGSGVGLCFFLLFSLCEFLIVALSCGLFASADVCRLCRLFGLRRTNTAAERRGRFFSPVLCWNQCWLECKDDETSAPRARRRCLVSSGRSRTLFPFCHDGSIGCAQRCPAVGLLAASKACSSRFYTWTFVSGGVHRKLHSLGFFSSRSWRAGLHKAFLGGPVLLKHSQRAVL